MTNIAIEVVLLTPLLILQILLLPFVANTMWASWASITRDVALKETASQMASTIQQLYLSVNRKEISTGIVTLTPTLPLEIAKCSYYVTGLLKASLYSGSENILFLNLTLRELGNSATAQTPLGLNVSWNKTSVFDSSSPKASIKVQKFTNGTVYFSF